jgi:hypothetical protein
MILVKRLEYLCLQATITLIPTLDTNTLTLKLTLELQSTSAWYACPEAGTKVQAE